MAKEKFVLDEATERDLASDDKKRVDRAQKGLAAAGVADEAKKAPRDESGELILKRREVHSGRALTVSSVEWSVAENMATPSSTLEGFMWDKETEVDRFRERVPLANLASQCRLSAADPESPKPRDWVGPVRDAVARSTKFVIIPECKRFDPTTGSLRKRYDLNKLTKEFVLAGVPAISVNCDGVIFGGSLEDVTKAREASSKAALSLQTLDDDGVVVPPILASDLLLYPYQLYKMRLAGADAVNLVVGALATKDLVYLTKIAASLQLQVLVTVTSKMQVQRLSLLAAGAVDGMIVSNRIVGILTCESDIFLGMSSFESVCSLKYCFSVFCLFMACGVIQCSWKIFPLT
jgi:indole-3-glycerol phosphate synthase